MPQGRLACTPSRASCGNCWRLQPTRPARSQGRPIKAPLLWLTARAAPFRAAEPHVAAAQWRRRRHAAHHARQGALRQPPPTTTSNHFPTTAQPLPNHRPTAAQPQDGNRSREALMTWLSALGRLNGVRCAFGEATELRNAQDVADFSTGGSDGFLLNVAGGLLRLAQPFVAGYLELYRQVRPGARDERVIDRSIDRHSRGAASCWAGMAIACSKGRGGVPFPTSRRQPQLRTCRTLTPSSLARHRASTRWPPPPRPPPRAARLRASPTYSISEPGRRAVAGRGRQPPRTACLPRTRTAVPALVACGAGPPRAAACSPPLTLAPLPRRPVPNLCPAHRCPCSPPKAPAARVLRHPAAPRWRPQPGVQRHGCAAAGHTASEQ